MAHPVLISLANIDASVRSKTSLHGYLLLALLPIPKFLHKNTCTCSMLQDWLVHQALNKVLHSLKVAATVGVMMSDPVGNLWYCYTLLASWIADTPEESLLSATSPKVSPVTTAMLKEFGDLFCHPSRTATLTLTAICTACAMHDPSDYLKFLKVIWKLGLNGVIYPFFKGWPMSDPFDFFTLEVLHHFHQLFWDHDANWCILTVRAAEIDFHFSLLQTTVGHRSFEDGISNLKQVTGRDHRTIQRYMVSVIASAVPHQFLIAIHSLIEFQYLAQAPSFTDDSLVKVSNALQEFHDHKNTIVHASTRKDNSWRIPKLELLQSIVPSIRLSSAVSQWSADVTEHVLSCTKHVWCSEHGMYCRFEIILE